MATTAAAFSGIGRRDSNQDCWSTWLAGDALFAAVADGLGGLPGGGQASGYVVDYLQRHAIDACMTAVELAGLVRDSHAGLRRLQARHPAHASMATTLAVMAVRRGTLVAAHCGDTRLYLIRGDDARQLSRDHSEAQRLLSQGLLSEQAFMHDPRKHILDSALGVPDEPVIQAIECAVDVGDWLVIASDGAWSRLAPSAMVDIGKASCSPEDFAAACRRHVEARRPDDNYTLVVATIAA